MGNSFSVSAKGHDAKLKDVTKRQAEARQAMSVHMKKSRSKLVAFLKANHMNHSILYQNDNFYNLLSHVSFFFFFFLMFFGGNLNIDDTKTSFYD